MIKVQRDKDKKVFTSNMSEQECIMEIHFCTSYTQVIIQELDEDEMFCVSDIVCAPTGTTANPVDLIGVQDCDFGKLLTT